MTLSALAEDAVVSARLVPMAARTPARRSSEASWTLRILVLSISIAS
jgi:hypothetical protein